MLESHSNNFSSTLVQISQNGGDFPESGITIKIIEICIEVSLSSVSNKEFAFQNEIMDLDQSTKINTKHIKGAFR